jgi:uncharacterized protein YqgC (DUF456 family)
VEWVPVAVGVLFSLLGIGCLLLVVLGLPGTWLLIGLAAALELLDDRYLEGAEPSTFGWLLIGFCVVLAGIGEAIEAAAGAAGTKAGGGSRRGMLGAILGGIAGAIVFTPLIPIPVLGTLLGAMAGSFLGAFLAERSGQAAKGTGASLRAASGAAVGKLIGTVGKAMVATAVWAVLSAAAIWP